MVSNSVLITSLLPNHGWVEEKGIHFTISYYDTKYANAYDPSTGFYNGKFADSSYIKTTGFSVSLGKQLKMAG